MKEKFFKLAKKYSVCSDHHQHKMGCIIVKKNKVVGIGWNTLKTHPESPHPFKSMHAEFMAVLNTCNNADIEGSSVYIFRAQKDGMLAKARPCKWCWNYLSKKGVKNIYYTIEDDYMLEAM